jgi:trehalose 6-phosphate synthase/phosphatase
VAAVDRIRAEGAGRQLILGVDRLDYTKGIPRRLLAIERLLEDDPSLPGKIRFVQVAVPSRTQVDQYERFTSEVNELVGRINGRYGTPTAVPIHYLYRNLDQRELTALYRAAEVMLVTPLRDGMNLVAKEYVASHGDDRGVLILSEFAGAASELGEAISVNPYDIDAMAGAIRAALAMPEEERRFRMQALRQRVARFNVHAWAEHFLATLQDAPPALQEKANTLTQDEMTRIVTELSRQPQLTVFLDYDGTLVPYAPRPELAVPDEPLLALLASLAAQPGVAVHVISGRTSAFLESWLGRLPIGLHAEHGLWSRSSFPGGQWTLNAKPTVAWKERVLPILHEFTLRTPGSRIEEKDYSIAWHYRIGDPEYNEWQARELKIHLSQVLTNAPVAILSGEKVIELQPHDANKGRAALSLLGPNASPQSILAAGDDETDERMFMALPNGAVTIHVGPKHSIARHNVVDVATFRNFLRMLVDRLGTRHT